MISNQISKVLITGVSAARLCRVQLKAQCYAFSINNGSFIFLQHLRHLNALFENRFDSNFSDGSISFPHFGQSNFKSSNPVLLLKSSPKDSRSLWPQRRNPKDLWKYISEKSEGISLAINAMITSEISNA